MSDQGWGIVFVLVIAALITLFLIVAVWQGLKLEQAKAATREAVAQDEAYRTLAERATAAQQAMAEEQRKTAEELAALRSRVAAIETMMREVG